MDNERSVLTPEQMRAAEQYAVSCGISLRQLMDNAGTALADRLLSAASERDGEENKHNDILLLCGSGNNGGDGYVAAARLAESCRDSGGRERFGVTVVACGEPKTELAKAAAAKLGGSCKVISLEQAIALREVINSAGVIADCVFGTGFHGELRGQIGELFAICRNSGAYTVACDCPSGVDCLSGQVSKGTLTADETVTFHMPKLGMLISPAREQCGRINTADIGIPKNCGGNEDMRLIAADAKLAASFLPSRPENSHKGTFGKAVLVCGSGRYLGAASLAAGAALRSGAGLVELCSHPSAIAAAAARLPECIYTSIPCDEDGFAVSDAAETILRSMEGASAAVIGCGLGRTAETEALVCELIRRADAKCPLIIDADGINCLSAHIDVLKEKQTEILLTPHPAELARLCGTDTETAVQDLIGCAQRISRQYGVTVHARSVQSFTVSGGSCYITDFGCSALAKGGSGDMLAGLTGGLAAQGMTLDRASVLADLIMGSSARELCRSLSPRGVTAADITARFPQTFFELEHGLLSEKY